MAPDADYRLRAWFLAGAILLLTGCAPSAHPSLFLTRPALSPYRCLHPPGATPGDPVTVRFFGTSSLLFSDGDTAIVSDGFVSRPGPLAVQFGRLTPRPDKVEAARAALGHPGPVGAVIVTHSHFDHAMDAPEFARQTRALLLGSPSTINIGYGMRLPRDSMAVIREDTTYRVGAFTLSFVRTRHAPGDRYTGVIDQPLKPRQPASAYRTDVVYSVFLRHPAGTLLLHGSAGYLPGALDRHRADVVYLGIGELGWRNAAFIKAYWQEVVVATRAKRVVLVHWDDPTRQLGRHPYAIPYVLDNLHRTMKHLRKLAIRDTVQLYLPELWRPMTPFSMDPHSGDPSCLAP
jgi:L-ascorbate metabolism protein UlaG (beta-lactamase superfamily)